MATCNDREVVATKEDSKGSLQGRFADTIKHRVNVKDDGYEEHWSPRRKYMGILLHCKAFDVVRGVIIFVNILLLISEVDVRASGDDVPQWITMFNYCLILVYVTEIVMRILVYREQYFHSLADVVDMTIITADCVIETVLFFAERVDGMPSLVILRTFRLLRLGRTHRALTMFPELNVMVLGMRGAIKTILWGVVLLTVTTVSFAILAVQIIHPVNQEVAAAGAYEGCTRCPRAYESVAAAALTITQGIIAGDSWGLVTIPVIEHSPATSLFFLVVFSILGMMILNLILAVVIDSANQARQETDHQIAEEKERQYKKATAELLVFCSSLDKDESGTLSLDEFVTGYAENFAFQDAMKLLDISQKDMDIVFRIMDQDNSGEVRYDELVQELYKMKSEDSHTMITFIKFYVQEIQRESREEVAETKALLKECHGALQTLVGDVIAAESDAPLKGQSPDQGTANNYITAMPPVPPLDIPWLQETQAELKFRVQDLLKYVERSSLSLRSLEQLPFANTQPGVGELVEVPLGTVQTKIPLSSRQVAQLSSRHGESAPSQSKIGGKAIPYTNAGNRRKLCDSDVVNL
jgi:Ca2+-binding EF-hand superfamily protein